MRKKKKKVCCNGKTGLNGNYRDLGQLKTSNIRTVAPRIRNLSEKNRTNKKGGGVICYVKSTLVAIKIDKQDAENYDSIYVEIIQNYKKPVLATVYRPPILQAADNTALYNEIQSLIQGKNAIVIGDFNCANVDWRLLIGDQEGKVEGIR